jgi:polysaccharide export outer membrane protein
MNKLRRIVSVCMMAAAFLLLASCASPKKFVYLNDMTPGKQYPVNTETVTIVHENDRLDIKVSCRNPELAVPFNSQVGAYKMSIDGGVSAAGVETVEPGYRVDADGNIVFPILGKIKVAGKSLKQVSDMIAGMISEGGYIRDPQVSIEFLNFKYTVLGAVNGKGTYTVDGDRITILEAIAKAGDLSNNARLDRVSVIRTVNGKQEIYYNDIRTADIFMSPTYYLQQNDIVYVEPKYKDKSKADKAWQVSSFVISLASLASSIIWALTGSGIIGGN